jgi:hypothetical protein
MAARPTPDRRGTPSIPGSGHLERPIPTRHGRHLLPRRAWAGRSTAASSTLGRDELIDATAGVESASLVPRSLNPPLCLLERTTQPARSSPLEGRNDNHPPPTQPESLGEQHPAQSLASERVQNPNHRGDQRGSEPKHPLGGASEWGEEPPPPNAAHAPPSRETTGRGLGEFTARRHRRL